MNELEQENLIEVKKKYGASPQVKIICPKRKIN